MAAILRIEINARRDSDASLNQETAGKR